MNLIKTDGEVSYDYDESRKLQGAPSVATHLQLANMVISVT